LKNILYGDEYSIRRKNKDSKIISLEEQVDILIEQACDPNLLSRMWIGWSPHI